MRNWKSIKLLPKNKLIKSSYLWFVLIPICIKLFSNLNTPFKYVFSSGYELIVNINLPFSWQCFYISSLFVVMANILYELFCPVLIKRYSNFNEFKDDGNDSFKLIGYIPGKMLELSTDLNEKFNKIKTLGDNDVDDEEYNNELNKNLQRHFWFVFEALNIRFKLIRSIVYLFYIIGILLFAYVIFQNVKFSIQYLWS